jgi:hypothetical protein
MQPPPQEVVSVVPELVRSGATSPAPPPAAGQSGSRPSSSLGATDADGKRIVRSRGESLILRFAFLPLTLRCSVYSFAAGSNAAASNVAAAEAAVASILLGKGAPAAVDSGTAPEPPAKPAEPETKAESAASAEQVRMLLIMLAY